VVDYSVHGFDMTRAGTRLSVNDLNRKSLQRVTQTAGGSSCYFLTICTRFVVKLIKGFALQLTDMFRFWARSRSREKRCYLLYVRPSVYPPVNIQRISAAFTGQFP